MTSPFAKCFLATTSSTSLVSALAAKAAVDATNASEGPLEMCQERRDMFAW